MADGEKTTDELYRQRDRLRLRISKRKRGGVGGQNIGVSFCDS